MKPDYILLGINQKIQGIRRKPPMIILYEQDMAYVFAVGPRSIKRGKLGLV
jgi:hypothetical protein